MDEHAPIVYDLAQYKEETESWNTDRSAFLLRYYTKHYFLATDRITGYRTVRGDQYVYQSPNKICVTGLAPTHPLIAHRSQYEILDVRFNQVLLDALPQPTAIPASAKKGPPPFCNRETVICSIVARDLEYDGTGARQEESLSTSVSSTDASAALAPSSTTTTASATSSPSVDPQTANSVDPSCVVFEIKAAMKGHIVELSERLRRSLKTATNDPEAISVMLDLAATHGFIAVINPKKDEKLEGLCSMEDYNRMRKENANSEQ